MKVKIKKIDGGVVPHFAHSGDACADCYARVANGGICIPANSRCLVNLGFAVELPEGYEMQIRGRSGLASRGIDVALGTVDSGYRGEVCAVVINNSNYEFSVENGDRICQAAIRKTECIEFVEVLELGASERGDKGFGSTGV